MFTGGISPPRRKLCFLEGQDQVAGRVDSRSERRFEIMGPALETFRMEREARTQIKPVQSFRQWKQKLNLLKKISNGVFVLDFFAKALIYLAFF
jgi:hypothetical protein